MRVDIIEFNGIKFRRYPESENWADRSYFTPGIADRQRGVKRLHQELWRSIHGPIPDGCDIHHADGNPLNNDPDNLVCLDSNDHQRSHNHPGNPDKLNEVRHLAAAWHRSEEGRKWHSEHAKWTWKVRKPLTKVCDQCGESFETLARRDSDRFCSNACKSAWRRDSGIDDEQRTCEVCGTEFTVNKYYKKRTCSRSCARRLVTPKT